MTHYPEINTRVLQFMSQQPLGTQYGNGECWTLAEGSVIAAGAQGSRPQTPHFGARSAYVWGDRETNLANIQPGDIVQFINYQARWETRFRGPGEPAPGRMEGVPHVRRQTHHTAIVRAVIVPGQLLEVYEQNVSSVQGIITTNPRLVQINQLALVNLTAQTISRQNGSGDTEQVTSTFTVLHAGLRFYHPHPPAASHPHRHTHRQAASH